MVRTTYCLAEKMKHLYVLNLGDGDSIIYLLSSFLFPNVSYLFIYLFVLLLCMLLLLSLSLSLTSPL